LTAITGYASSLLSNRFAPPPLLEAAFRTTAAEFGVDALDRSQYIAMMKKLIEEHFTTVEAESSAAEELMKEVRQAFDCVEDMSEE
jgi:hypothetical protein